MGWYSDSLTGERHIKQAQCQEIVILEVFLVLENDRKYGVLQARHGIACAGGGELVSGKDCFGYLFYSVEC
jgi:hypothetical protein